MSDLTKRLCRPGYDLQKEQAIQEAIIEIRELRAKIEAMEQDTSGPKLHVGNLPTLNQDTYPALGAWWVQLWDGDDVFARAYGPTPEEAHNRARMLAAAGNGGGTE